MPPARCRELPSVSVVVPCHNSFESLLSVLLALRRQPSPPDEVICVDDNSSFRESGRTRRLARALGASYVPLPRVARHRGRRSQARNAGTHLAKGDVILYLDADMAIGPEYLPAVRVLHARNPRILLKGTRVELPRTALESLAAGSPVLDGVRLPPGGEYEAVPALASPRRYADPHGRLGELRYVTGRWEWCASNNLSVRRRHALAARGWDERFVGWGEEDMDFAYRMSRLGLTPVIQLAGPLQAGHIEHPVDHDANRDSLRRNGTYLLRKFPAVAGVRRAAYERYDLDVSAMARPR